MPTGKVAVFTASGVPYEIEELPTPEVGPGGILIKNTHAVICGSDLHGWRGDGDGPQRAIRRVPGHEFTGVVHSIGAGVDSDSVRRPIKEGDRSGVSFFQPVQPLLLVHPR